ncbi:MAG TPA: TetR/AcrR family transcriptional regulator [Chitinophagaceae bacterium]|nr:TetR/AcrR family transcriptional regulator [Chitinophagaceae bacterium]
MKNKTNDIVEKATTLFIQNGLQSVTMDEVALYARSSKKTLYENFQSKEMLVNTIVQQIISKISKYIRVCTDISPNAITEMRNFSSYILDLPEILTPAFMKDLKKYYPETHLQLRLFRINSIIPFIQRCLQRGIEEEVFRPDIDKTNVAWLYCWQLQNVLEGDTFPQDQKKVISGINDLLLHGIVNSKGLKLLTMNKQFENIGQNEKPGTG